MAAINAYWSWLARAAEGARADHAGPAYDAEREIVNQMISTICLHANGDGWNNPDPVTGTRRCTVCP